MVTIYVLQLEQNKYYVGKSTNPYFRLEQHFNSNGSSWTQLYKPVKVLQLIHNCDDFDEDKYTLKYMAQYGVPNVRGGSFCETKLSNENMATINKMLLGSQDRCYGCGGEGHFADNCPKLLGNQKSKNNITGVVCGRCQRFGHHEKNCYSKTNKDGVYIKETTLDTNFISTLMYAISHNKFECRYCKKEFKTQKGAIHHENIYCKLRKTTKPDTSCVIC